MNLLLLGPQLLMYLLVGGCVFYSVGSSSLSLGIDTNDDFPRANSGFRASPTPLWFGTREKFAVSKGSSCFRWLGIGFLSASRGWWSLGFSSSLLGTCTADTLDSRGTCVIFASRKRNNHLLRSRNQRKSIGSDLLLLKSEFRTPPVGIERLLCSVSYFDNFPPEEKSACPTSKKCLSFTANKQGSATPNQINGKSTPLRTSAWLAPEM